jgi:hypothetical protein
MSERREEVVWTFTMYFYGAITIVAWIAILFSIFTIFGG